MLKTCLSAFLRGSLSVYVNLIQIWTCLRIQLYCGKSTQHVFMTPQTLGRQGLLIVETSKW